MSEEATPPDPYKKGGYYFNQLDALVGRTITGFDFVGDDKFPRIFLSGTDKDGNAADMVIQCDDEGNGPGAIDHNLPPRPEELSKCRKKKKTN